MLFSYETDRLILRILKPEAAPTVLDFYLRDRALFEQYEPDRMPQFYSINFQKSALRFEYNAAVKLQSVRFYVFPKEQPDLIIGTVCFHNIRPSSHSSCEIGYKFSSFCHHQGYATEALHKVLEIIFLDLQLHRVMAWVIPENQPSIRLLERLGFCSEGLCRDYLLMHGRWVDHRQYSLLAPDYISSRQSQ